jgi:hypothetical protein
MSFSTTSSSQSAQQVVAVFNSAWDLALDRVDDVQTAVEYATATAVNPQQMTVQGFAYVPTLPTPPVLTGIDPLSVDARFTSYRNDITAFLTSAFTTFLATYFPTQNYLTLAQAWLEKALGPGGTGLSPVIEQQIYDRDRSRILTESARAIDESVALWANRGYPLPPGAAVGEALRIQATTFDKVAESSRDAAIKAAQMEIENIRFAVTTALDLRKLAINSAVEYLRAVALGPTIGAQVATAVADFQTRLAQAFTTLYTAQVEGQRVILQAKTTDVEVRQRALEANLRSANEAQHDRVAAAMSATSALGNIASAAVNSLHASAGIAGSESI